MNRRELTRFCAFVHSPYHCKHEDVQQLIHYLDGLYPDFPFEKISRQHLAKVVFPFDESRDRKLPPVMTYAQRQVEQFWAMEQYQQQESQQVIDLMTAFRQKKSTAQFERLLEKRAIEVAPPADYLYHYKRALEAGAFFESYEREVQEPHLRNRQTQLDLFYFKEKLKNACEVQVRLNILSMDYEMSLLETVLEMIRQRQKYFERQAGVYTYFLVYRMLENPNRKTFQQALDYFLSQQLDLGLTERMELYNYFMNFCIGRINRGEKEWLQDVFELYRDQLENGLLLEEGSLSEWDYKNIVTTGLRLEQLDWVREFIEQYRELLPPDVRDNAYLFNLASWHYFAGEFPEVLELIREVEYRDIRYSLGAKALLLRTYYDMDLLEPLLSLTGSFRNYLKRNHLLAEGRRLGYANLFRLTRKAAQLRSRLSYEPTQRIREELLRLKIELEQVDSLVNRSWLEAKLDLLEEKLAVE